METWQAILIMWCALFALALLVLVRDGKAPLGVRLMPFAPAPVMVMESGQFEARIVTRCPNCGRAHTSTYYRAR